MSASSQAAPLACEVRELDGRDTRRWDDFVYALPEATFFHLSGWKRVIEKAFGHRTYFFYAQRGKDVVGVLPLAHVRSLLFGNSLVSLPFCVYGGVAAADEEAATLLEKRAAALARELKVDCLELRHRAPRHADWPRKEGLYVTFRKAIDPDPERNMLAIPRKQRAMVRKGIDAGLQAQWDEGVDRLHDAYSQSVRNLGTPVFSKRYFAILREVFGDACDVLTVTAPEGQLVASVMSFYFRDEVLPYYGGGTDLARTLKGNDFMYWELMRRACERGCRVFDYGRSKVGTGSYSFKKNWGFEPEPLTYEYMLERATSVPEINPLNPKYRYFIAAWQRLPLGVTRWLGPHLVRNLG